jgi:ubiquinone/menaquinone biosynthesis C-methylase UbiE
VSDDLRTHLQGVWSMVANSWTEHADFIDARGQVVTEWLLAATAPTAGDRVLELACGPGAVTLSVAGLVDPGEVIASDVAVEMVDTAVARALAHGFTNVHGRRLDIEDVAEPDATFDVVYCRDGLQFALDRAHAVAELARVTKPGGRAAVAVWAERERNPWLGLVLDVLSEQLGQPVPPPGIPGPFSLGDATVLDRLFTDAGFADVRREELSVPFRAPSFDGWWLTTTSLAGPLALVIANLDGETTEKLRTRAHEAAAPFVAANGSIEIPGVQHVLCARR